MTDYSIFTFVDNDDYTRIVTSKITGNKNLALSDAVSELKTTNIRILSERKLNEFEKWAHYKKGMLIDIDETGQYKSLETRAHASTWEYARVTPNYLVKSLLQQGKSDRRINKKIKTDIRKDFGIINAQAGAEKYLFENGVK
jgi:hypothetical protein